ncbi:interleukin-15 receptor subunit alpha isoform X1 [Cervus canadensis]|uniref:interleukin-15 receptor subunit alpha isoform X1 n=1 Tax=Cervus canadensis TaxID=1574408 RepID=UPI001C9E3A07|nr:interleukin-15 receptor subunit alpha isoform X1 [Cervus canadensis]XP_043335803.1 interleukin-15 receptor subunit alpha isoform X1 [Cervus canadensis]
MSGRLRGRGAGALPALGLLLLLLLLGSPATPGITCPTPTSVEHADIRVKNYSINSRERYVCNSGFKRKAGTSSLTQCVFNETAKVAHWTTPNLKCIRDPSLSHQRPPSTAAPTGLTPEPESPTPSGKEPDLTSKSDTKVATRPATGPGSRLPSTASPVGTTGVVSKETTYVPAQTAAKAPEHTHPALQDTPGAYQYNPRVVTAAVTIPVTVLFVACLLFLLVRCRLRSRQAHQPPGVEMESMESVPMTTGADARGEDTEIHLHGLGGSGDAEASRGLSEGPALLQPERT